MTHKLRRLTTGLCITCLLVLTHAPVSLGQKLKAADVSALVKDLKADDAKVRFAAARRLISAGAADFNEAIKIDPQNYANYEGLGDAYAHLGDMERAGDAWGKALAFSTNTENSARIQKKLNGAAKP